MGCAFSPDGTCILTATASDGKFRLYDTPYRHLNGDQSSSSSDHVVDEKNAGDNADPDENDNTAISTACPQHEHHTETPTYSHSQNYISSTPNAKNQQKQSSYSSAPSTHPWKASLTSHQGGPPPSSASYYAWYPLMTSSSPLTSLYVTCRGHSTPIHLIDAYTSNIRASYRPYNGVDEMEGPTVVQFSPDGSKVYGTGFRSDRTIAVFDVALPGREGMVARLGRTRRSGDGQKGIPSALAFPQDSGGRGPSNVFAVGTYSPASIYIYDDRMSSSRFKPAGTIVLGGRAVVGHGRGFARKARRGGALDDEDSGEEDLFSSARVNWFQSRARGGVTQLAWAPPGSSNPHALFSASRRADAVLAWDARTLSGSRPGRGLRSYARDGDTNQRLEFAFDAGGEKLFVGCGSRQGAVKVYAVGSGAVEDTVDVGRRCGGDAVNGVSYFPHCSNDQAGSGGGKYNGMLAVAVGSRRFYEPDSDSDDVESKAEQCPGFLQFHALKG